MDVEDWSEEKFNISLSILMNEYNIYIQTLKDTDEKANRYLIGESIFIAGFFGIISSSLSDELRFSYPLECIDILSYFFIFGLIASGVFSFYTIHTILNSFAFIESRRMPDLDKKLNDFKCANTVQYKNELLKCYQEAINFLEGKIKEKQGKVKEIYPYMQYSVISILLSCLILFFIKVVATN